MNKERIDDLVDILTERTAVAENTLLIRNQQELLKYIDNPTQWKTQQLNNLKKYKKEVLGIAKEQMEDIKESAVKVYLIGYKEVDKDAIQITKTEIRAKVPPWVQQMAESYGNKTAQEIVNLGMLAVETHKQNINIISALATPDTLYDTIKQQMERGIDKGMPVTYADGKTFSWKAYMEMQTRTVVKQEIVNNQAKFGAKAGIIFYMCDVLGDSADDHADFQGKVYYNADSFIPDNIQQYIDANGILSMQEVMAGDPYLTTRPNCRHNFHSISTQDVLIDSPEEILRDNGLVKGNFKEQNYGLTQEQRLNERTIRKYKTREQTANELYKTTGDPAYLAKAQRAGLKVKEWSKRNNELIKDHPDLLERDRRRESLRVITGDLGVKYDYKFDKDTGAPTPTPTPQSFNASNENATKLKKQGVIPTPPVPVNADTSKTLDQLTPKPKITGKQLLNNVFLEPVYDKTQYNKARYIKLDKITNPDVDNVIIGNKINEAYGPNFIKLYNEVLTTENKEDITDYTGGGFKTINMYLRSEGKFEEYLKLRGLSSFEVKNYEQAVSASMKVVYRDEFNEGRVKAERINNVFSKDTPLLKLDKDTWLQRGVSEDAIFKMLKFSEEQVEEIERAQRKVFRADIFEQEDADKNFINVLSDKLLGKTFKDPAYVSTGGAKGKGFNSGVAILNVFTPKGTKHIYANPISWYGGMPSLNQRLGKIDATDLTLPETEAEVILDKNLNYHITKISYGVDRKIYIDVEVVADE
jgi:hypothetical protein